MQVNLKLFLEMVISVSLPLRPAETLTEISLLLVTMNPTDLSHPLSLKHQRKVDIWYFLFFMKSLNQTFTCRYQNLKYYSLLSVYCFCAASHTAKSVCLYSEETAAVFLFCVCLNMFSIDWWRIVILIQEGNLRHGSKVTFIHIKLYSYCK